MASSTNISDWKKRGQIDYFPLFVPLWLSFNAWFKDWGIAKDVPQGSNERDYILKLKEICDGSNKTFSELSNFLKSESLQSQNFKTHLAGFAQSLESVSLRNNSVKISFRDAWISGQGENKVFENLFETPRSGVSTIKLTNNVAFKDDYSFIYKALIENLYQVRCLLFHGELEASEPNHRVIKNAYLVLNDLTNNF